MYIPVILKFTTIATIIFIYTGITSISFLIFFMLKINTLKQLTNSNTSQLIILFNIIFFLNLAGIPPLPGFFIKYHFLINIINYININIIIILIIFNFTIFYLYIQFYKNIETYIKLKTSNSTNSMILLCTLIFLTATINFYPIYTCINWIL